MDFGSYCGKHTIEFQSKVSKLDMLSNEPTAQVFEYFECNTHSSVQDPGAYGARRPCRWACMWRPAAGAAPVDEHFNYCLGQVMT